MKMVAMLQFDPRSHERSVPFARNCLDSTATFIGRILFPFLCSFVTAFFLLAFLGCAPAHAGVGVILNESLDSSLERITGSGHTAVYFSHICPESPVKLRLCRPGEEGSVMSNYINLGEDQPYEWNIVSLSMYVYGVENSRNRPLVGTDKVKKALEERYREKYLAAYCSSDPCKTSDKAEWREMVGAGLARSMYIFLVETSTQQDLELIAKFNSSPNENHFNGVTRNCADFTKDAVNAYFPHSAHRDFLNDFGMTSPKAVARSFTHYALSHPEMQFRVLHFSQLPGTIKRSTEARSGTEQLYHSKKLLVPMIIFANHELPVVAASYLLTGRFNPEHEFEQHSAEEFAQIDSQIQAAKDDNDDPRVEQLKAVEIQDRQQIVGTLEEWKAYRKALDGMSDESVREGIVPNRGYLKRLFKLLDEKGKPTVTANGSIWMDVPNANATSHVGLSASNVLAHRSDPHLAYEILLERTDRLLKSPKHSRETMLEFKDDWSILQAAKSKSADSRASAATVPTPLARDPVKPSGEDR
jgi:hypothetical protein